ncbi:hypothetical protein PV11_03665 [Exophiala sideris]|uniref:Transcription factor domain-containing protein n=1 Tax=Exophiala sideris TaxID=1016849 RepID=A0A0D1VYM8_9EURO|nr:hypothetical protein PV11_03665 [Exophiala sideris]
MRCALDKPYLLQAIIYAGATYRFFLGPRDSSINLIRIQSYHETIKHVREAVEQLHGQPPDGLLLAVALLTMHGPPSYHLHPAKTDREHYRDNDFYFTKPWEPSHFSALMSLTKMKGGPRHIAIPSVAAMVFIIDVVECYSTLRKPTFPIFVSPNYIFQHLRKSQSANRSPPGFQFLRNKPHGRSLLKIMERTNDILENYDMFLQNPGCGVDLWSVIAARRVLQYQALSTETTSDPLYTMCRLGLLVHLIESLELLPAILPFHENASRQLMLTIDDCDKLGYWQVHPDLMLWATVLGGLTARERPLRWWFAEQLRGSAVPVTEPSWKDVQAVSRRFLPFVHGHGEGCSRFWKEACGWLSGHPGVLKRVHLSTELEKTQTPNEHASLQ